MTAISRRAILGSTALLLPSPSRAADIAAPVLALKALERKTGARIGIAAIDTGSARAVFHREAERFVMCSTFKLSLAAAVLARADAHREKLDRLVTYDKPALGVSPATTKNWPHGMSVAALCEAAVIYSDNTAANVLLEQIGGPAALTQFWRSLGDQTSRLDDIEPKLNLPDGERNTTTPTAMLGNLKQMLLGDALSAPSRAQLLRWMHANTTGTKMLRAGLPSDWQVGDKTGHWIGSDPKGWAVNDFAIITPPGRKPILAIALTQGGSPDDDQRVAVLAEIGRILANAFS
jgi:beta-lactamase class A